MSLPVTNTTRPFPRDYSKAVGKIYHRKVHSLSSGKSVTLICKVPNPVLRASSIISTLESISTVHPALVDGLTIIVFDRQNMPVKNCYGLYKSRTIYLCNNMVDRSNPTITADPYRFDSKFRTMLFNHYFVLAVGSTGAAFRVTQESYNHYMTEFVLLHELGHAWNELQGTVSPIFAEEESNANEFAVCFISSLT